jgi:hypothetical protein
LFVVGQEGRTKIEEGSGDARLNHSLQETNDHFWVLFFFCIYLKNLNPTNSEHPKRPGKDGQHLFTRSI